MKKYIRIFIALAICISFIFTFPTVGAASISGDINNDGMVSVEDAVIVLKIAASQLNPTAAQKTAADLNGDKIISTDDARLTLIAAMTPTDDAVYVDNLIAAGFPRSYTENLLALHKAYPEWVFEPFITGLEWSNALAGERNPHKKQLIENNVQASYMCSCSSCKGVIQEAANWVSASEEAVAYYLDPRNFLNEKYIFQFESTAYDESQTQEAVETIIKNTWMYNSHITYLDASGNTCTYTENGQPVKYSQAIMRAAKDNGMSAYYLASKIVQEVGSSTASYAGGSSGACSPYNGIYNYYNIGAYTGAADGLSWANGYMKTSMDAYLYKTAATTTYMCTIPSGTSLYYMGTSGNFYKVKTTVNGTSYEGYLAKSTASMSTTYGRPWDNPYKSIYYGAAYIHKSFSAYQYTGYLQKFNVNSASGSLYNHEYMANVRAAASEAYSSYRAYTASGIMSSRKVFSIPVFTGMPGGDLTAAERFSQEYPVAQVSSAITSSVTLSWPSLSGAQGYEIYKKSGGQYSLIATTASTSYTDTAIGAGGTAEYKVRAYKNENGSKVYSLYCPVINAATQPSAPVGLTVSAYTNSTITLKWNAVSCKGYEIYRSDSTSAGYTKVGTVTTNTYTDKNLLSGVKYSYKIKAYTTSGSNNMYSGYSSVVSATTTGTAVTYVGTVNISDGLNIRQQPNTSSQIVCVLPKGHKVYVLSTSNGWHNITFTYEGTTYTAYASAEYITLSEITSEKVCPYTEPDSVLSYGTTSEGVKWLQWHLWQLGYIEESSVTGYFGDITRSAVKQFQTDMSLEVDGYVGPITRSTLKGAL